MGLDNETYIFQIGDEEVYVQPVIWDKEINVFYSSEVGVAPNDTGTVDDDDDTGGGGGGGSSITAYEEVGVEVITEENIPGGYVIAEITLTNKRSYPITNVIVTSYLSNMEGQNFSETHTLIDEIEPGTITFHQNLSIPVELNSGEYKFNVIYEKFTFIGEGSRIMFKTDSFDMFQISGSAIGMTQQTLLIVLIIIIGVVLFMFIFYRDEEDEEEKKKKKQEKQKSKGKKKKK
jgi:hypothetical protein